MKTNFVFADMFEAPGGDLRVDVPVAVSSKAELMSFFARALRFPDWFGGNWDAFYDCLCDLSWLNERRVVITHQGVPDALTDSDKESYLGILGDAVASWHEKPGAHELIVVFPKSAAVDG